MGDHEDAGVLLRALAQDDLDRAFDPDSPFARASLERILAQPPVAPAARDWRRPARRLAYAVVPLGLAAALAFAVVPSLTGPSSGLAQAAVLARAAQALQQPGTILDLQVQEYRSAGVGPCMPGGQSLIMCAGTQNPEPGTGISADPSNDPLTDSYQEWVSPDGSVDHTLYGDGDETVTNSSTNQYQAYDAQDNTLLELTGWGTGTPPPPTGSTPLPIPSAGTLQDPSYYENLYQEAQSGGVGATLVGQTAINGESVYELQFDFHPQPPANPPAGDMCGGQVCQPPDTELLLYLDSQTFTPVRLDMQIINNNGGTLLNSVSDYSVQSLPDTTANQSLLAMGAHTGATQIQQTAAQWHAALDLQLQQSVAANAASGATGTAGNGG